MYPDIKAGGSLPGRTANAGQTRSGPPRCCFEKPGSQIEPELEGEPEPKVLVRLYKCVGCEGFGKLPDVLRGKGFKRCQACAGLGRFVEAPTEEVRRRITAHLWKNLRRHRQIKKKRKPLNFKAQGGKS